ncbi:phospholipase D/nuclease [Cryphonectria parasitica EP155]|uniref:Phospholipase D/nuclease n=1 Tax=Cryphonectria parasitica (strain ATCC 38755 / EP155) TaxID=660469 RepID=A0A9P5CI51_CRYP1|nr:phospholipase D/nuclease [Cryphonectria parasitica EP155]KAF3760338.1 phospholipase D/nuclease [Cryphonectria parasitica EP155]
MESFTIGTGASIYTQRLLPAILAAEQEIILVTCYWAQSKTLTALCDALVQLARRREAQQQSNVTQPLRLRICFSSRSLLQKLLHTSSSDGYVYPPSTWTSKLGLPSPEVFAAGKIDVQVKSLFFLPFSVMHPKFLIVDRRRAFLPSCNISWEPWLEGCLELSRRASQDDPIDGLLRFYKGVWESDLDLALFRPQVLEARTEGPWEQSTSPIIVKSPADTSVDLSDIYVPPAAVEWLPSWHTRNPSFCLFPWQTPKAPETPLNTALLRLFDDATRSIILYTPNLTSPPVLSAVLRALARGVDVNIVTSRRMMVWEQVLTAWTTAERCIKSLTRKYTAMYDDDMNDLEAQTTRRGSLKISYYRPANRSVEGEEEEPMLSHLKLSIFDSEHTVLGSGNMDRASWFTSQELGIVIHGTAFATAVKDTVDRALEARLDPVFPAPQ